MFQNAFLISSPLQAFVADAILATDPNVDHDTTVFFVEDQRYVEFFDGVTCFAIGDTRLKGQEKIADNLKIILDQLLNNVTLWVSDILWPMNNAIYTALHHEGRLNQINFIDEGMVLYWQEQLTMFDLCREYAKFTVLQHRLKTRFTYPARRPFYDNRGNGSVHALHPELLSLHADVHPLHIDIGRVARIAAKLDGDETHENARFGTLDEGSALVLSQPYHRVGDVNEFKRLVASLANHLRGRGYDRLYVKLHPSEGMDVFDRFYGELGFETAFCDLASPVEAIMQSLPSSCMLASFNSSALFNARKFGFKGQVLSYGLNWVAAQYPMRRNLARLNQSLFLRANLEVVLA